jgi:hypothetical protein
MVQRAAVKKLSNIRFLPGPKRRTVPKALDLPLAQAMPREPLRVSFKAEPVYLSPERRNGAGVNTRKKFVARFRRPATNRQAVSQTFLRIPS